MYKQYKYKSFIRICLYLFAALVISYYISDSYKICTELTDKELLDQITEINYLHTQPQEVDLNISIGGALWNLFINTLQIVFLVMFILILYINELIEKWYLKK